MAVSVTDLPQKYQEQVIKKWQEQQARRGATSPAEQDQKIAPKPSKYHNTPAERVMPSGAVLHFDSQKEARRYDHLILRLQAGQIKDLRLQVDFTLQEAYTDTEGRRVRAIRYKADFTYYKPPSMGGAGSHAAYWADQAGVPWVLVVEDVKSRATRTKEYLIKRKLMKERRGIEITEV